MGGTVLLALVKGKWVSQPRGQSYGELVLTPLFLEVPWEGMRRLDALHPLTPCHLRQLGELTWGS